MDAEELTAREAAAWAAFEATIAVVPRDRREEPALADGWSVKDALWHVAYWWADGIDTYGAMMAGTHEDEDATDEETDATNARVLAEGRAMTLEDVETGAARVREEMLDAWSQVADREDAAATFLSETVEHYEEHLPSLREFASTLGAN